MSKGHRVTRDAVAFLFSGGARPPCDGYSISSLSVAVHSLVVKVTMYDPAASPRVSMLADVPLKVMLRARRPAASITAASTAFPVGSAMVTVTASRAGLGVSVNRVLPSTASTPLCSPPSPSTCCGVV